MKLTELKNLIYCQNHITWSLDLKKEAFFATSRVYLGC